MRRAIASALVALGAGAWVAGGCALGLDASKIGASLPDASLPSAGDGGVSEASTDASDGAPIAAETGPAGCTVDTDCVSTNACRVGGCDAGACVFVVCPTGTCQGASCNAATSACTTPTTYGFHAAEISVTTGAVGCGGNAATCVAAAYPFVFLGTTNGVVAYAVNDPSNGSVPPIPVTGLPFLPAQITALGSRVYFVGSVMGAGPAYRVQVASLDVPSDPLSAALQASTTFEFSSVSSLAAAWSATDGSLFLVDYDATRSFPSSNVAAPLKDSATLSFFPSPAIPSGGVPVAVSGSRLVVVRWQSQTTPFQTYFSFETAAATASAQNSGEQATYAQIGPTSSQGAYAQGPDGSVLWNTGTIVLDDAGAIDTATVRLAWLASSGTTSQFDATANVDVELYSPAVSLGTPVVGPVAWVDPSTALVLAAAAGTLGNGTGGQTSVQVAVKTPKPALASGRRYVVPANVQQVGAAASGGYAYVLAADAPGATTCTLHVFAPACAGP